jgi:asparagine synthase (glutamine-hydrolysing)
MSEFAGLIRLDGGCPDRSIGGVLAKGLAGIDSGPPQILEHGAAMLVFRRGCDAGKGPSQCQLLRLGSGDLLLADARLDNTVGDESAVVTIGRRWLHEGLNVADHLYGDFAFAVWSPQKHELLLARDALGVRTLYYTIAPTFFAFATRLRALLDLPGVDVGLDELGLAEFLTFAPLDVRTIYRAIRRVPSGGTVRLIGGREEVRRYWSGTSIVPVRYRHDQDYVEAAREQLDRAVACRMGAPEALATTLSGGFDSAGVTATAARMTSAGRLRTYTRVPSQAHPYTSALDEQRLAGSVAQRYPQLDWRIIADATTAAAVAAVERSAIEAGMPQRTALNPAWFAPLRQRARDDGARVLLMGVMGNSVLSWSGAAAYVEHLQAGRWWRLLWEIIASARSQRRSLRSIVAKSIWPLLRPTQPSVGFHPQFISKQFLIDSGFERQIREAGYDPLRELLQPGPAARLARVKNEFARDMDGIVRAREGIEKRDPYSDRRFVELILGMPESQFLRNGENRWLARRTLADRLPAELLSQQRIGRQVPEWYYIATRRLADMRAAVARMERSPLACRVLEVAAIKQVLDRWPASAEQARDQMSLYGHALGRAIAMGEFLYFMDRGCGYVGSKDAGVGDESVGRCGISAVGGSPVHCA